MVGRSRDASEMTVRIDGPSTLQYDGPWTFTLYPEYCEAEDEKDQKDHHEDVEQEAGDIR